LSLLLNFKCGCDRFHEQIYSFTPHIIYNQQHAAKKKIIFFLRFTAERIE